MLNFHKAKQHCAKLMQVGHLFFNIQRDVYFSLPLPFKAITQLTFVLFFIIAMWVISPEEKSKTEVIFNSLKPINGKLSGILQRMCFLYWEYPNEDDALLFQFLSAAISVL